MKKEKEAIMKEENSCWALWFLHFLNQQLSFSSFRSLMMKILVITAWHERKVDRFTDQAVTKILTSSSKFSGSYVLTLQTMNWLGHNNETQRTDEEEILEETRARFMSLSGGPYFPFLNRP